MPIRSYRDLTEHLEQTSTLKHSELTMSFPRAFSGNPVAHLEAWRIGTLDAR